MKKSLILSLLAVAQLGVPAALSAAEVGDSFVEGTTLQYTLLSDSTVALTMCAKDAYGVLSLTADVNDGKGNTYTLVEIGDKAFDWCSGILSLQVPSSVTKIGDSAFTGCYEMDNIHLGYGVKEIGKEAFRSCAGLTTIAIPASLESIGEDAFLNTYGLERVTVEEENANFMAEDGVLYTKDKSTLIVYPNAKAGKSYTVVDGVKTIASSAFSGNAVLTSLSMGNTVEVIGHDAFRWTDSLRTLDLGNVRTIDHDAISTNSLLESLVIPNTLESIGAYNFWFCESLTSLTVEDGSANFSAEDNVLYNKDKTTLVYVAPGKTGAYVMPASVTAVAPSAVMKCDKLTSITLSDNLETIGEAAFSKSTGLVNLVLNDKVTSIGASAFSSCATLKTVKIGNGLEVISNSAFNWSTNITSVELGDGVKTIEENAFYNCAAMSTLLLGNSVETIERDAFIMCPKVTTLVLPASIKTVGISAFWLIGLTDVYATNPVPFNLNIGDDVFSPYVVRTANLYVPTGSLATYQNAAVWSNFGNIQEGTATGMESAVVADVVVTTTANGIQVAGVAAGTPVAVYTMSGSLVAEMVADGGAMTLDVAKGIYLVQVGNKSYKVSK